ncbi:MAG: undecaprenyldiphospho-muramoylpentapeptide beta-N-acetylglucosaminyltransferase, partial [Deltaproteobacteria bacterium]|nr:undecaprenyldiphospho-muramoylpentapeptide beta-N-acetylglucosaminyltransferase [Deltaproteobacteria bacterium]
MTTRILMAAGATGGHIMPAVAVAAALEEKLRGENGKAEFLFVGAGRAAAADILDPLGLPRTTVKAGGIKGGGIRGAIRGVSLGIGAFRESLAIVKKFRPAFSFGAGGYVSGPVGLASRVLGVPLAIHEQNGLPGLTNRLLGKIADAVFLGDKSGAPGFSEKKTLFVGNPVRKEILANSARDYAAELDGGKFAILVLGGSQGAESVNRAVAETLPFLFSLPRVARIVHQAGNRGLERVREEYAKAGVEAEVGGFFGDMAKLYRRAHLVIARAGALTLAELSASRLPSILIPLPGAADDHQTRNARTFEEAGASILLPEKDLDGEKLFSVLKNLVGDRERLVSMSRNAARLNPPDAAEVMA